MRKDSDIMNRIIQKGVKVDVAMLPVHDSVIVQGRFEPFLRAAMIEEYAAEMKRFTPVF